MIYTVVNHRGDNNYFKFLEENFMKKFTKLAMTAAVALTMVGSAAALAGCTGAPAKDLAGIYTNNSSKYMQITQGKIILSFADSITLFSDNTFAASCVYECYYSSDGEAYNPATYIACNMYGSYEVVSEDADLGEKTIKLSDVTKIEYGNNGVAEKSEWNSELAEYVNTNLIGFSTILTSDYKMAEPITQLDFLFLVEKIES